MILTITTQRYGYNSFASGLFRSMDTFEAEALDLAISRKTIIISSCWGHESTGWMFKVKEQCLLYKKFRGREIIR